MQHLVQLAPDNDNKRRVLDASDIVRLVGEHVTLKAKGREFACLCPFHNDRNPSMYVVPAKQIFHCFVCGAGGNAIDFVMRYHGMSFRESLEFLAAREGIELVWSRRLGDRAGDDGSAASNSELIEANAAALRFFKGILGHAEHGAAARAVIEKRGISPEMVEAFGLGASPDRWDGLVQFAASKDLPLRPFAEAGLVKKRDNTDGHYDALRHRLVFPIFDAIGRPVAFGGRKLRDEDEPKYLNSPETKVFDKGSVLFGLKQALRTIQSTRTAIVTEGYTDVIACHQAGFTNAVATLGTALTPKHATALRRVCDTLILLFDGDEAGQRAADRALEVFFTEPLDVRIAVMQGGKDPDELLKREGGDAIFRTVLAGAIDFLDFRFARLRQRLDERGFGPGSTGRISAIESEIDRLVDLGLRQLSPVRQQVIHAKLAKLGGVDQQAVADTVRQRSNIRGALNPNDTRGSENRRNDAEPTEFRTNQRSPFEHALGCMLVEPNLVVASPVEARELLARAAYSSPPLAAVAEAFSAAWGRGGAPSLSDLLIELEDQRARAEATSLAAEISRLTDGDAVRVGEHWRGCIQRLALDVERESANTDEAARVAGSSQNESDPYTAAIERTRRIHERLGGNPLAMPRPRTGP